MHSLRLITLVLSFSSAICLAQPTDELDTTNVNPSGISILKEKKNDIGLNTLERVLLKHFETLFIQETESFIIKGSYTTQGVDLDLKIYAKRPGLLLQSLKKHGVDYTGGYDGQYYWTSMATSDENPIAALNDLILQFECHHAALLWGFEKDGLNDLSHQGATSFQDQTCYIIENTKFPGLTITHYIAAKTGIELGREVTLQLPPDTYNLSLAYDIPHEANPNGSKWPDGYKLYINDALYSHAKFESVRFNAGLMPWTFEKPKEL